MEITNIDVHPENNIFAYFCLGAKEKSKTKQKQKTNLIKNTNYMLQIHMKMTLSQNEWLSFSNMMAKHSFDTTRNSNIHINRIKQKHNQNSIWQSCNGRDSSLSHIFSHMNK